MIRPVSLTDIEAITHIYNHYICNSVVTFETQPVSVQEMKVRVAGIGADFLPWLVAEDDSGSIVGYAYASKWKGRCAYMHSVEITVYMDHNTTAQGWGSKLYSELFVELKNRDIHTAIGGISLPNPASIALHEKFAMKKVAHFEQVGRKFEHWVDVGYWQCVITA